MTMGRRDFITLLGSAAVAWPLAVRAQQPIPVIGFLSSVSASEATDSVAAFRQGLKEAGYSEGQNAHIAFRWADSRYDRLPGLAAELVQIRVAVIAAMGGPAAAVAAKAATTRIPVVFANGGDPVGLGLVASLNRPGGNVTGISFMNVELMAKRLGLLRELLPGATRFALLVNPSDPNAEPSISNVRAAALAAGRQIEVLMASTDRDIDAAFLNLVQRRADALLVSPSPVFGNNVMQMQIVTLATRNAVPTIFASRDNVDAGGLMSYGTSLTDQTRQAGIYTGRILKGEKPADLPVQQATRFELVINLKTAKALGLAVPLPLLALADEVIE
jgi:putative ABC transport system substrate-binding protein